MKCPYCNSQDTKVVDSRPTDDGNVIRRRRECTSCGERITTYEKIEEIPIIVVKKNKNREQYNKNKILNGIIKACEKRPISMEQMEKMADEIEMRIHSSLEKEIPSDVIGQKVMDALKVIDGVAYVRFASVYRDFTDIDTFMNELQKMIEEKRKNKL